MKKRIFVVLFLFAGLSFQQTQTEPKESTSLVKKLRSSRLVPKWVTNAVENLEKKAKAATKPAADLAKLTAKIDYKKLLALVPKIPGVVVEIVRFGLEKKNQIALKKIVNNISTAQKNFTAAKGITAQYEIKTRNYKNRIAKIKNEIRAKNNQKVTAMSLTEIEALEAEKNTLIGELAELQGQKAIDKIAALTNGVASITNIVTAINAILIHAREVIDKIVDDIVSIFKDSKETTKLKNFIKKIKTTVFKVQNFTESVTPQIGEFAKTIPATIQDITNKIGIIAKGAKDTKEKHKAYEKKLREAGY